MIIAYTYGCYLFFSCLFTYWVGRNLHANGRVFLMDAFFNDADKADSVNQLLLVGFYLVNFGFVSLFLSIGSEPQSLVDAIEYLATKMGIVLMVLGAMHFYNMRNIARMSSRALSKKESLA